MPSTIPAAKAAIMGLLETITWPLTFPSDTTPEIHYGAPKEPSREDVILADVASSDQTWFTFGPSARGRQESYGLLLVIDVARPGDTQQEATERAFVLLAVIEEALAANPRLVGDQHVIKMSGPNLAEGDADEGRGALITVVLLIEGVI